MMKLFVLAIALAGCSTIASAQFYPGVINAGPANGLNNGGNAVLPPASGVQSGFYATGAPGAYSANTGSAVMNGTPSTTTTTNTLQRK